MRFRGLAFRLSVVFLTGTLAIFSLSFYYTFSSTRKILLREAERDAKFMTEITMARLESVLGPLEQVPRSLVTTMDANPADPYRTLLVTQQTILDNPLVFASCIALEPYTTETGSTFYAHYIYETGTGIGSKFLGGKDYDYYDQDWYQLPKKTGKAVWIGPYYDQGGGDTLMCTYSVPFYRTENGERRFGGVLTLDISLTSLSEIVSGVRVHEAGYAFLLSPDGRFITAPDPALLNRNIRDVVSRRSPEAEANMDSLLGKASGFVKMDELRTAQPSWLYYTTMPATGWHFAVVFPESGLFGDFYTFLEMLVLIFIGSVAAILITVILISRNLARPLTKLASATKQIGDGDFEAPVPQIRSKNEIGDLARSFSSMQDALRDYIGNLRLETAAREKMEGELNVARNIQLGLLPAAFPDRREIDLFAELLPARTIGGDLYDFFIIDDDHLFIAIGDVSGKGVPASLFMAITRTLFRSLTEPDVPLEKTVQAVNTELCKDNPSSIFVTFLAGILKLSTGVLQLCNAGHLPPLYRDPAGNVRRLAVSTNIPLGITDERSFVTDRITLRPGDRLVFYTDGITEAENSREELYGEDRFITVVSAGDPAGAAEMAEGILSKVREYCAGAVQSDDITLMALAFRGAGNEAELILRNEVSELHALNRTLEALKTEWSIPQGVMGALNLVLEELFTNIVFYGFDDGLQHLVRIRIRREEGALQIIVEDDGKPFNILESAYKGFGATLEGREIGGEGIHLVKELMETIEYVREDGKNRVIMKKTVT